MPDVPPPVALPGDRPARPRRTFLARLAALVAAIPVFEIRPWQRLSPAAGAALGVSRRNASVLAALGDAVLPAASLGSDGVTRAVTAFQQWMDGYAPGAEANHGYGTARIARLPADPRPRWREQLAALDAEAVRAGGASFEALPRERRQALVRSAIADERGEALPSPLAARHVALAMLAHFYDSPAATDLCYEAQIGRQQCRPLAAQRQQPVALSRRPR